MYVLGVQSLFVDYISSRVVTLNVHLKFVLIELVPAACLSAQPRGSHKRAPCASSITALAPPKTFLPYHAANPHHIGPSTLRSALTTISTHKTILHHQNGDPTAPHNPHPRPTPRPRTTAAHHHPKAQHRPRRRHPLPHHRTSPSPKTRPLHPLPRNRLLPLRRPPRPIALPTAPPLPHDALLREPPPQRAPHRKSANKFPTRSRASGERRTGTSAKRRSGGVGEGEEREGCVGEDLDGG